MANFEIAYKITSVIEGGYANDRDDKGGETYKGIARNAAPNWPGWVAIDNIKIRVGINPSAINKEAAKFPQLEALVLSHYKQNYWDANTLDAIKDQAVANEVYDTGVNMGVKVAGRFLQVALNVLNLNGKRFPDLIEDGVVGTKTALTFNVLPDSDVKYVLALLNAQQGARYIDICKKNPVQEKFMRSWASRLLK